jgi:hypothetical protein
MPVLEWRTTGERAPRPALLGVKRRGTAEHAEGAAAVQSEEPVTGLDDDDGAGTYRRSVGRGTRLAGAPHADVDDDRDEIPGKMRRFRRGRGRAIGLHEHEL